MGQRGLMAFFGEAAAGAGAGKRPGAGAGAGGGVPGGQQQKRLRKVAAASPPASPPGGPAEAPPPGAEPAAEGSPLAPAAAGPAAASPSKEGALAKGKAAKGKAAKSEMEGVGGGALEAAAKQAAFEVVASWGRGEAVPYGYLAEVFEGIAEESKRLIITEQLTNAFRTILATTPEDLVPCVYLCVNRVAPQFSGVELGIGDATLIKALAEAAGKTEAAVKATYAEEGDLGIVAVSAKAKQTMLFKPKSLTARHVFSQFKAVATTSGTGSQERKRGIIQKMLSASAGNEAGYLIRSLQGKLRIGLAEQTVLTSLAHAALLDRDGAGGEDLAERLEEAARTVKMVYSECPTYDEVVPALLEHGPGALPEHCKFRPGLPIKPMLAKATNSVAAVLEKFSDCEFTCEYKYDGERAQVHLLENGEVKIYSRNSEDNTTKYPDIVQTVKAAVNPGVTSLVLDCEAVAVEHLTDGEGGYRILPFQVLSKRSRKDVKLEDVKVPVVLYPFDCLYVSGRELIHESLVERRKALYSSLNETKGKVEFAIERTSRDLEELQAFLDESVDQCTEGLIVKSLDTTYEPSKRSLNWLKLKKDYLQGVGDSLDLVVLGAWHGKGKRTGGYGGFLLASYNDEAEEYETVCKIGTGFSEDDLIRMHQSLQAHVIDGPRPYYKWTERPGVTPDVWFDAKEVWEVKAADLSISPVHMAGAGLVDSTKGIALRFPRYLRTRDDKSPEGATTSQQVADMYNSQDLKQDAVSDGED